MSVANTTAEPQTNDVATSSGFRWPSWAISLALHLLVLLALAVGYRAVPRGLAAETTRDDVAITLKTYDENAQEVFAEESLLDDAEKSETDGQTEGESESLADSLSESVAGDPSQALPSEEPVDILGIGAADLGQLGEGDLMSGAAPRKNLPGSVGRTSIFGLAAEGNSFIYAFDRSASMDGPLLRAAKSQLIGSIDSLADTHQFAIVFYNDEARAWFPHGPGRPGFATEAAKRAARDYVRTIEADFGSNHRVALMEALRLPGDVIFFLTDTEIQSTAGLTREWGLSAETLREVRRRNGGEKTIHVIHLGDGPDPQGPNPFRQLASENGGRFHYVNATGFR